MLSPKEVEFLTLVDMGVPNMKDIAVAMSISYSGSNQTRRRLLKRSSCLEVKFHKPRIESAIDLHAKQIVWREIAERLGYKDAASVYNAVANYCGGMIRVWEYIADPAIAPVDNPQTKS